MKRKHANNKYHPVRNFGWPRTNGQEVRIYRISNNTGYCLGFKRERMAMHVPAWLLHDIEARGVPLMGIRPVWIFHEIWWRFRQCFHTSERSSVIDHWIAGGGTLTETNRRVYARTKCKVTGQIIFESVPWFWDYFRDCFRYHRRRLTHWISRRSSHT